MTNAMTHTHNHAFHSLVSRTCALPGLCATWLRSQSILSIHLSSLCSKLYNLDTDSVVSSYTHTHTMVFFFLSSNVVCVYRRLEFAGTKHKTCTIGIFTKMSVQNFHHNQRVTAHSIQELCLPVMIGQNPGDVVRVSESAVKKEHAANKISIFCPLQRSHDDARMPYRLHHSIPMTCNKWKGRSAILNSEQQKERNTSRDWRQLSSGADVRMTCR
ncbi:hypothetical protein BC827DRAFT_350473 [Russula dissimulans]|nr:hypothetical protein BC827DRAFT_350473 [Russula dissimulans]